VNKATGKEQELEDVGTNLLERVCTYYCEREERFFFFFSHRIPVEDVPGAAVMGEEAACDVRAFAVVGNTSWFVSQLSATVAAAESYSSSRQFNTKQNCFSHNNSSTQSAS
jgi:hypothetical protein